MFCCFLLPQVCNVMNRSRLLMFPTPMRRAAMRGSTARIARIQHLPDGRMNLVAVGAERFRIDELTQQRPFLRARVEILRPGQKSLWRRVRADGSYASANDPRVLAGLADRPAVSGVVVHWPSGRIEAFAAGAVKVDAYTTLREGAGKTL